MTVSEGSLHGADFRGRHLVRKSNVTKLVLYLHQRTLAIQYLSIMISTLHMPAM